MINLAASFEDIIQVWLAEERAVGVFTLRFSLFDHRNESRYKTLYRCFFMETMSVNRSGRCGRRRNNTDHPYPAQALVDPREKKRDLFLLFFCFGTLTKKCVFMRKHSV